MGGAPGKFGSRGWWEPDGEHRLLHVINPARIAYIDERAGPLPGKRVADVGCGGGILSEQLARRGAQVVAVDPAAAVIATAQDHADKMSLPVDYRCATASELAAAEPQAFDLAVCMEVLEHVEQPAQEIAAMAGLLRPKGSLIVATINRTALAYAAIIVGLERCMGALPAGSHRYEQFRTPQQVTQWCRDANLQVADVCGANWSFFGKTFLLSRTRTPVNYFVHAKARA